MATDERSMSKKGSSRVGGEPVSSLKAKRPSGEESLDDSKRPKVAFGLGLGASANAKPKTGIQIKLSGQKPSVSKPVKPKTTASIFNDDDDDDDVPEEMPPEAKMRMRNIGRDTPTSAGPNSFGKTKQGFCDSKKVFEKNLKEAMDSSQKPDGQI